MGKVQTLQCFPSPEIDLKWRLRPAWEMLCETTQLLSQNR